MQDNNFNGDFNGNFKKEYNDSEEILIFKLENCFKSRIAECVYSSNENINYKLDYFILMKIW